MQFFATAPAQTASAITTLRISLHVLAATIWVGGQFVVAGFVPTLRALGGDAPRKIARAFSRIAWPAFALLIITGLWNFAAINHNGASSGWYAAFGLKMAMVVISGIGVALHVRAKTAKARGIFAGVGALASIVALILGVFLAG